MTTTPADRLDQPLYGAAMGQAISRFFRNYAVFSGRASRSEYWWVVLFYAIVYTVLYTLTLVFGFSLGQNDTTASTVVISVFGGLFAIVFLGSIVPSLAIQWRRLHDAGFSGGFYFLGFIPSVGGIILIVLSAMPPNPAGIRFDRSYSHAFVSGSGATPLSPPSPTDLR